MRGLGKRPWRIIPLLRLSIAPTIYWRSKDIEGDTDEAAIEKSRRLQSHHSAFELWKRNRLIHRQTMHRYRLAIPRACGRVGGSEFCARCSSAVTGRNRQPHVRTEREAKTAAVRASNQS